MQLLCGPLMMATFSTQALETLFNTSSKVASVVLHKLGRFLEASSMQSDLYYVPLCCVCLLFFQGNY